MYVTWDGNMAEWDFLSATHLRTSDDETSTGGIGTTRGRNLNFADLAASVARPAGVTSAAGVAPVAGVASAASVAPFRATATSSAASRTAAGDFHEENSASTSAPTIRKSRQSGRAALRVRSVSTV